MASFWVADLTVSGEVKLKQEYQYVFLEKLPGAMDLIGLFSTHLWRSAEEFDASLPGGRLHMRWRASSETSGIATLRYDRDLASVTLLLCGRDAASDEATVQALQQRLLRELHDTGIEPGFDLVHLKERPIVASLHFRAPADAEDQYRFALADRCLGASYFRKHGLA
jgi:hypothetical protein